MEVFCMVRLSHKEVYDRIPFMIVAETRNRAVWNTGRVRRKFAQEFTESERRRCNELFSTANRWAFTKGVPNEGVTMRTSTFALWMKLADFCANI